MRVVFFVAAALTWAGCTGNAGFDFIEVHGSLADGTPVNGHNLASVANVQSLMPALGLVVAVGSPYFGPEDLAGFRIEWQAANVHAGDSFPSDINGPVAFYVSRQTPDGGTMLEDASLVNGGTLTFSMITRKATGTFSNMVLSRGGQTIITIDSGSFQATLP
jgi:hypothetical protein